MSVLYWKMNTLILVDIQNDFVPGGALAVPQGDAVVPVVNRLQPAFDLVVASQDWHPANHCSFVTQHPEKKPGDVVQVDGLPQVLWPVHCVQGSCGAELVPSLQTERVTKIINKGVDSRLDSYSAFFSNGHRRATKLGSYLKERGVTDVYVAGLATDYCVRATALDSAELGFKTHLIVEGCRGVDLHPGDVDRAIAEMKQADVNMCQDAEIGGTK